MKKEIISIFLLLYITNQLFAQEQKPDSLNTFNLNEVVIQSNRIPVLLKNNPGSVSLVTAGMLSNIPKSIGIEESLRLVPGVRIDNQHDGERVHVSIRGQGILTERGLRGIGVLIDGIPVNDPSGFAPDLYDVDWSTVKQIEVLRGPSAGLYGGGGAGGIISISTNNGGQRPVGGEIGQSVGSNGFLKSFLQLDGSKNDMDYRISYSHENGDGYRDHQAFKGDKLYEKINFHPSEKLFLTQIYSYTAYFQQNPEGLNLSQFDNLWQANPDARPFNEYQKTNRNTIGLHGLYKINDTHDFEATSYYRFWNYKETSNRSAEYRNISNPGLSFQYNMHLGKGNIKNNISLGTDLKWQQINMYKLESASNPNRIESVDDTNLETDSLLANQIISQQSTGLFAFYKLEIKNFNLMANLRYDFMGNELTNKMLAPDTAKTSKDFSKTSLRIGASYNFSNFITLFANWSQGFMPPSTEELASNPVGYYGFNTHLVPATSNCYEIGLRGFFGDKLNAEITGFVMKTENDFFRFKQSGRGNQEVFYGNAGNSKRFGIESFISYQIIKGLSLQIAYTYANYKYTSGDVDPVYTDPAYVLTTPPADGQYLPNSPKHQLYSELVYSFKNELKISFGAEYQSEWAIYTDSKAYNNELDPAIYQNWLDGFKLFNARVSYLWQIKSFKGEFSLGVRNLSNEKYMAFTEPDPDGNAYQPGPEREFFGNIKISF